MERPDEIKGTVAWRREPPVPGGLNYPDRDPTRHQVPSPEALKDEYRLLWQKMVISPLQEKELERLARRIEDNRDFYSHVSQQSGVPWNVIGIIHYREAGLSKTAHLYNGDPLSARTKHVPKGLPISGNPPFTWDESALDALRHDKIAGNKDWTIEGIAFLLERYNGYGYRWVKPEIATPYLWAFSSIYSRGYFTEDGRYNPNKVCDSCGAMPLLKLLINA